MPAAAHSISATFTGRCPLRVRRAAIRIYTACVVAARGRDDASVAELVLVQQLDPFPEGLYALDAEHRSGDLLVPSEVCPSRPGA